MYVKIHRSGQQTVLAACDRELIGRKLKKGNITIEISKDFYMGEPVSEDIFVDIMTTSNNINMFGHRTIACAVRNGMIDPESVIEIEGIPHAQVFRI